MSWRSIFSAAAGPSPSGMRWSARSSAAMAMSASWSATASALSRSGRNHQATQFHMPITPSAAIRASAGRNRPARMPSSMTSVTACSTARRLVS